MTNRIRMRLEKGGRLVWVSHLDFSRGFARALRRSGLPIAFTQGFSPHPRYSTGPPLPLGVASAAEMVDLHLDEPVPAPDVLAALRPVLPDGMSALDAAELGPDDPKLSKSLFAFGYVVSGLGGAGGAGGAAEGPEGAEGAEGVGLALAGRRHLPVVVDKPDGPVERDARPAIFSVSAGEGGGALDLVLSAADGAVGVLEALQALLGRTRQQVLLLDILRACAYSAPDEGRGPSLRRRGPAVPLLPTIPEELLAWRLGAGGGEEDDAASRPRHRHQRSKPDEKNSS